jgi:hypothetical protein
MEPGLEWLRSLIVFQIPALERIKPLRNPSSGRQCDEAVAVRRTLNIVDRWPGRDIEDVLIEWATGCV